MKAAFFLLLLYTCLSIYCHPVKKLSGNADVEWTATQVRLPAEIRDANRQFSGLCLVDNKLYLLPECRLQENQEAVIFSFDVAELDASVKGLHGELHYKKYPLVGLKKLREKMLRQGNKYEGLEAMIINNDLVFISVETDTPSPDCYLIKGVLNGDSVLLDTTKLTAVRKPLDEDGQHIYNAGFEAIALYNDRLLCFYEYNYFNRQNYVYSFDTNLEASTKDSLAINRIPYRITDIAITGDHVATAINYFYSGGGNDVVYRPPSSDTANFKLVHDSIGFNSYCRLLQLDFQGNEITSQIIGALPPSFRAYNWEGIAPYKNGYFLVNDKYTPARPYTTVLLYLSPR